MTLIIYQPPWLNALAESQNYILQYNANIFNVWVSPSDLFGNHVVSVIAYFSSVC